MKSQFAHFKNRAKGTGIRGLAVMLCFVMLLTAIGAGTMMTAFSAKADLTGSTAIADTAQKVVDIANSVDTEADDGIIPKITKKIADLADTGANVDIAESGWNLQHGARVYFNAYGRGSGAGSGNNVKKYVYMAIICNTNYYQIVKMDHISNTELYTCYTSSANTNTATDVSNIFFFSSDASGWACKSSSKYDNPRDNVQANCGGFCSNTYGANLYNNHVYYYTIDSSYNLTLDDKDGSGNVANSDSVTNLKAGNQKASVYVSSDGTTYSYAGTDNTTKGGDVVVGGYGWSTAYEATDKLFATSSKNNGTDSYSQFEKPILTTWITMKVNEVYDGYHFMGWYSSSGTLLESATTYYYQLSSNDAKDVHARFLKPEYTTAKPASASQMSNLIIINKGSNSNSPSHMHLWNTDSEDRSIGTNPAVLTRIGSTNYYYYPIKSTTTSPSAIVLKADTWGNNDANKLSKDLTKNNSTTHSDNVFYWSLGSGTGNSATGGNWSNFSNSGIVHLGSTSLSNNKASAAIGEEVTLTATAPSTGTFKSGVKYSYYYTTNGSTWYQISAGGTNTTQKFYPPANGVYTYKVTVSDPAGLETVVATASTTTTVGVVGGKYIVGSSNLVGGTAWAAAPEKGLMSETSSGSGTYTKTFGNLPSGTYEFRITTLNNNGTSSYETDEDDAISGSASPIHVAGATSALDNIQFTLTENKKVTITYNDSTKAVTVDVADVQAIDVVVYAGPGGSVEVTYGTAVTTIEENDNATIKVAYGDSIDLEATGVGTEFTKWYKNLDDDYKGTPAKEEGYDSLENEVITQRTVYVATFGGSSGSSNWIYSADRTNASPEISGSASSYYMLYNSDKAKLGREAGNPSGDLSTYQSGSDYWCDLTSVFGNPPSTPSTLYIALSTNTSNSGIRGDKSNMKINGTTYTQGNGPTFTNTSDETLFAARFQEYNEVSGSAYFIELYNIDWSKINALGVRAVYTGSGGVNYKFYYKTSSGGSSGGSSYIPSTNYYAKDSSIREGNYNYWIYPTKTTVTAVDGQVSVDHDHTDGHHWVDGFAMKGSEITVSTIVPHKGQYKTVDRNGNVATDKKADEKYYVAGFSFNGVTPELISESSGEIVTGVTFADYNSTTQTWTNTWTGDGTKYTCTYKIPTDMKESMLEITPIIFVKDAYASETVMVYINGYNDEVKNAGWGNTLYLYPFYKSNSATYYGQAENFGRYPGQPIINYGGQLFCQIPLTDDASKNGKDDNGGPVKGITINNGYYDDVHKTYCNHVSVHRQTYDYDDFAKIYNQKKTKNGSKYLYSIYFSFKYFAQNSTQQHRLASTTNAIDADADASRYNDLLTADGILEDTSGTVTSSKLITAGESSTGWQDLQDSLGNNVDLFGNKVTNASAEPLRVFSLGYEYNNSGRWATEWAVYHKNGDYYELIQDPNKTGAAGDKYSMIVPSALIFNDKASLSSATQLDSDLAINGYDGIYGALEAYRGVPVKICYEHDIPDAFNPKNYRCDGRWTYTTTDDYVRSNVKIEYYDKDGILQDDEFVDDSHVGDTTGCSAYFTNSAYYGATVSDSEIIDNNESYTFAAEAKGSYEFVGWYMYDTAGHESTITKDSLTADTPRSGNFTLAARFKYVASGNLTISNSLATNSVGRANTYLGVTLINGDKQTVVANVNSNTAPVTIDKSYINASSNYQIKIDIRTVPLGENTFKEYICYTTNGSSGSDVRSAASNTNIYNASRKTNATDTYTVTVKASDIFSSTNTNDQIVKAIEYISELNPVHYTYSVKFNYTSRQYGDQAFTQTGELTSGQINDTKVVTGTSGVADKKLTKAFLAEIAPHESNFNEKITWNFDSVVDSQTCTYDNGTNTYNISLNISKANATIDSTSTEFSKVRHGYFTVPYAQTNGVANADGSGKVAKTEDTTFTIDLNYDDLFKIGDNFVTAPTVIYETVNGAEHERYFMYWEMSTVSSKRGDSRVVGKCYFPEFNYRALDNYNIRAVYTTEDDQRIDPNNGSSAIIAENSYASLYDANSFTTIDFIGNSRNQWNSGDKGSNQKDAGDLIYNDFILSFKPEGADLFKDISGASCGVVIERVKLIETNSSGTNAKTLQEYAKDYSTEDLATIHEKIETYVSSNFSDKGGLTLMNRSVDQDDVNTKNRCHYVLPMYNNPTGSDLVGNNQKYLYRAYSYMIIAGEVTISDAPTYFYMYDIAVA